MSALYSRGNAILPVTGATDLTGKEGYGATLAAAVATLGASATVVNRVIILDGGDTDQQSSVGVISNLQAPVRVKLHSGTAAIAEGDMLIQATDGSWTKDTGSGARVQSFMALESGIAGDLVEAAPQTPTTLS